MQKIRQSEVMFYSEFKPTQFDSAGAFLEHRQDWIVVPVSQTRDSQCLEKANFATALEILGGESDTVEVYRFGHWGPGWFEIILAAPERASEVENITESLENYPVLSDEKLSELENEDEDETWEFIACGEFQKSIEKEFETNLDTYGMNDEFRELYHNVAKRAGVYVEHGNEGACFPIGTVVAELTQDDIEPFIDHRITLRVDRQPERIPKTVKEYAKTPLIVVGISVFDWASDTSMFTLTPPCNL